MLKFRKKLPTATEDLFLGFVFLIVLASHYAVIDEKNIREQGLTRSRNIL